MLRRSLFLFSCLLPLLSLASFPASAQQILNRGEIRDLLVGKRATLANGTMDFSADGKVTTLTNAGRKFAGTYTISDDSLCRDYGADGGAKCYRVIKDNEGYNLVDTANARLRFAIAGAMPSSDQAQGPAASQPASPSPSQKPGPIPNQTGAAGIHSAIAKNFFAQGGDKIGPYKLGGTVVVSNYALQPWSTTHTGGVALFEFGGLSVGWILKTMGGGSTDASALVSMGVPKAIAEQLIAGTGPSAPAVADPGKDTGKTAPVAAGKADLQTGKVWGVFAVTAGRQNHYDVILPFPTGRSCEVDTSKAEHFKALVPIEDNTLLAMSKDAASALVLEIARLARAACPTIKVCSTFAVLRQGGSGSPYETSCKNEADPRLSIAIAPRSARYEGDGYAGIQLRPTSVSATVQKQNGRDAITRIEDWELERWRRQLESEARERSAADNRSRMRSDFLRQHNVSTRVDATSLRANPFVYKDKVVAVMAHFTQMLSEKEALFESMIVTDFPSTLLGQPVTAVVAIRVTGNREYPPGSGQRVAVGQFVGLVVCNNENCRQAFSD